MFSMGQGFFRFLFLEYNRVQQTYAVLSISDCILLKFQQLIHPSYAHHVKVGKPP